MRRLNDLEKERVEGTRKTQYNFKDTIARHTQGKIEAVIYKTELVPPGRYEKVEIRKELKPASIVSLPKSELIFDNGGRFNLNTRKLDCYEGLNNGDYVINTMRDGKEALYRVIAHEDKTDYSEGLHIYYLERSDNSDRTRI